MTEEYRDEKGRKLRIWNGRGWGRPKHDKHGNACDHDDLRDACDHVFICAHSAAEAIRLYNQVTRGPDIGRYEVNNFWSECWGTTMEGIEPEVGIWARGFVRDGKPPRKIL